MNIFHAIILGVVEGITEFLPISSTFHLIFTSKLLGLPQNDFIKLFEVVIQSGAILSVALLYASDVVKSRELMKKIIISFLPTALVGFILYKFIKNVLFESDFLMIGIFVLVGVVFIFVEKLINNNKITLKKATQNLSYKEALLIGLTQSLAVIPGVSRAGAVIVGMILLKYKREQAAYYSFLLSVPTIFAAALYDLFKMRDIIPAYSASVSLLGAGFLSAFICSYFVVKWLISYLQKNSLIVFGYYRIVVAIILLLIFL